jgi:hypothetical protein
MSLASRPIARNRCLLADELDRRSQGKLSVEAPGTVVLLGSVHSAGARTRPCQGDRPGQPQTSRLGLWPTTWSRPLSVRPCACAWPSSSAARHQGSGSTPPAAVQLGRRPYPSRRTPYNSKPFPPRPMLGQRRFGLMVREIQARAGRGPQLAHHRQAALGDPALDRGLVQPETPSLQPREPQPARYESPAHPEVPSRSGGLIKLSGEPGQPHWASFGDRSGGTLLTSWWLLPWLPPDRAS